MRYFFLQTALSKTYQENYQVTTQIGKKNIPNKKLSKKHQQRYISNHA